MFAALTHIALGVSGVHFLAFSFWQGIYLEPSV